MSDCILKRFHTLSGGYVEYSIWIESKYDTYLKIIVER